MSSKKTKKHRGSKTHGRGSMKKGRGSGLKGGRGKAGLDKHKYMKMTKEDPNHFGRHGFKRPQCVIEEDEIINVGQLKEKFPNKKKINLEQEGIDKLLGGGEPPEKMDIKVKKASKKAVEKIKEKNGKIKLKEK